MTAGEGPEDAAALLHQWGALWGVPDLAERLEVRYSARLRRALGRCDVRRGRLNLHPALRNSSFFAEVLCHEAAHFAAWCLHGRTPPHGPEWRSLVEAAGYAARTRVPASEVGIAPEPERRCAARYLHRCPVCQATRTGRRPVPQWRCRACVEAGLPGEMVVTRVPDR